MSCELSANSVQLQLETVVRYRLRSNLIPLISQLLGCFNYWETQNHKQISFVPVLLRLHIWNKDLERFTPKLESSQKYREISKDNLKYLEQVHYPLHVDPGISVYYALWNAREDLFTQ